MNSLRQKLQQFLYGRYGIDQLYYGLLGLYVILFLLQILLGWKFLSVPASVVLLLTLLRVFSRKHDARRRENRIFLQLWAPVKTELVLLKDRFRHRKQARYRHCKHCRAILKLPVKRGGHTVVCPKCHERFHVQILF
ncbi:MAG: hypothetical protein E7631_09870 [Ruminococcaceae bacterium]|nr:hypothetical protein [Oscillospiraceae bacterium]